MSTPTTRLFLMPCDNELNEIFTTTTESPVPVRARREMATDPAASSARGVNEGDERNPPDELFTKLKLYTRDGIYLHLQDLLKTGPGRRKSLPNISIVTEKTLLQLFCLKLESCESWNTVFTWFGRICPESPVTPRRLRYHIERVVKLYSAQDGDFFHSNMSNLVHFEMELSDCLVDINLCRSVLLQDPSCFFPEDAVSLTNGLVIGLEKFRAKEGLPFSFTHKWTQRLFCLESHMDVDVDYSQVKRRTEKLLKEYKNFQKRKDEHSISSLCGSPFEFQTRVSVSKARLCGCEQTNKTLEKRVNDLLLLLEAERKESQDLLLKYNFMKEERDTLRISIERFQNVESELVEVKRECQAKNNLLTELKRSKLYKRNCLYKNQLAKQSLQLQMSNDKLHDCELQHAKVISDYKVKLRDLKKNVKVEQSMKSKYKSLYQEKKSLLEAINDESNDDLVLRDAVYNRFTESVRLTYIALMSDANLAAQNCSMAVHIVANYLFGKNIKLNDLPSVSTVLNFANEAYHIAHSHVIESINNSEFFTLASDGTSRQKRQYLERHVILNNKCTMSLGFTHIARDDADTLLEKTIEVLDDLCVVFCLSSESCTKDEVFKDVIRKLTCLMSDRASVNKSFNKKMLDFKKDLVGEDESIHFLFCNAHFLLGLVTAVDKAMTSSESQLGVLGRDQLSQFKSFSNSAESAAFRAIRIASDVFGPRGDEKCGCREEWLAYCEMVKRPSKFTSYRTNRFNNLFENASALIYHHNDICIFLSDHVSHSNLKFQSLLADVKDTNVLSLISAIALFHLYFTGPYWLLMNSTTVSYGDFPAYVCKMNTCLEDWSSEESVFDIAKFKPVFSDFPCSVNVTDQCDFMQFVSSSCEKNVLKSAFVNVCKQSKIVLERQLDDFIQGGVYGGDLAADVKEALDSCPLTNLVGERLFGDLDCDMQRRRNASLHLRSTLNMMKRNKTMSWVRKKNNNSTHSLMSTARKHAAHWKERSRNRDKAVRHKIRDKIVKNKEEKTSQEIQRMERKRLALEAVINHGGICDSKGELDSLMTESNALSKLKEQLRFRKVVLGENISCTGNTKVLYERLCHHLGFEPSPLPFRRRKAAPE